MLQVLRVLLFGKKVEGEILLNQPTFRTTYPSENLPEEEWRKFVKFGSRYGHRGSFYERR